MGRERERERERGRMVCMSLKDPDINRGASVTQANDAQHLSASSRIPGLDQFCFQVLVLKDSAESGQRRQRSQRNGYTG